jgi:hypothetical protein
MISYVDWLRLWQLKERWEKEATRLQNCAQELEATLTYIEVNKEIGGLGEC